MGKSKKSKSRIILPVLGSLAGAAVAGAAGYGLYHGLQRAYAPDPYGPQTWNVPIPPSRMTKHEHEDAYESYPQEDLPPWELD